MFRIFATAIVFGIVVFALANVLIQIMLKSGSLTQDDAGILFPGSVLLGIVVAVFYFRAESWKSPADREAEERYRLNRDVD